uniref:Uncharacterized protein n=1 Tax=Opuntia streptacantha TaxID=393608 RepID=A0A7C9D671_OPUST
MMIGWLKVTYSEQPIEVIFLLIFSYGIYRVRHVNQKELKRLTCRRLKSFLSYCQKSERGLSTFSPQRPLMYLKGSLISLTKSRLFLVCSFHFRRRNAVLVYEGN